MPTSSISSPFPIFTDIDGQPLENGYIFIGIANLGPIGNPINVYWDAALTIPAAQPIRTLGGYPINNGTPARLYVSSQYSIQVQNRNGSVVYSAPVDTEFMSSANISYLPAGTGAVATTVQAKLRESVSVMDFMTAAQIADVQARTLLLDVTAEIQAAILAASIATGGIVFFPTGTYKCSSTINMYPKVTLRGTGSSSNGLTGSVLKFSHTGTTGYTGDGLLMVSPINTSTSVNTSVENLTLWNTNASNIGGGYDDVCGTFVNLFNVTIIGFKYGVIFDQTELATIRQCNLGQQVTAGIWLVNGADHTVGASAVFTNRINIAECQINQSATCYGIVDDGGYAHTIDATNFNGCLSHIRGAGQLNFNISNSELESAANTCMVFTNTTLKTGASVGQSVNICVYDNTIIPTAGNSCINFLSGSPVLLAGNSFGSSSATLITGLSNVYQFTDLSNFYASSPKFSGSAARQFSDNDFGTFTPVLTFATPGNLAVAYSTRNGVYQRVGNVVTFSLTVITSSFTHTTASGNLKITGLPFAGNSTSNLNQPLSFFYQGITKAGYTQFVPWVEYSQATINFSACGSGAGLSGVTASDTPSGGSIYFQISGSYQV